MNIGAVSATCVIVIKIDDGQLTAVCSRTWLVDRLQLITRGIRAEGFWITPWLLGDSHAKVREVLSQRDELVVKQQLRTELAEVFPLSALGTDFQTAGAGGRNGKVLLDFRR